MVHVNLKIRRRISELKADLPARRELAVAERRAGEIDVIDLFRSPIFLHSGQPGRFEAHSRKCHQLRFSPTRGGRGSGNVLRSNSTSSRATSSRRSRPVAEGSAPRTSCRVSRA